MQKITTAKEASATWHVAVYGIYFDHDSANIKKESKPSLKAIADMLKTNNSLKLYVVGHTDMTGGFDYNVGLSLKRATAVVKTLVTQYGIAAGRLESNRCLKAIGVRPTQLTIKQSALQKFRPSYDLFQY